jgi:hypothetical protein
MTQPESGGATEHLSSAEQHDLARCEQSIAHLRQAFIDAGSALATIRDERLYRAQYATFEAYCQQRWGFSRVRAHQLIDAARTSITLLTIVNTLPPDNEAQVRPLSHLDTPEEQQEAWQEAVERSNGSPTGRIVQEVVHRRTEQPTCHRCGAPARDQNRIEGEWVWLCAHHQAERVADEQEGRVDRFGYSDDPVPPPAFQRGDLVIWTRGDGTEHLQRVVHDVLRDDFIEIGPLDAADTSGTRTVPASRLRLAPDAAPEPAPDPAPMPTVDRPCADDANAAPVSSELPAYIVALQQQLQAHGWQVTRSSAQVWHVSRHFAGEDAIVHLAQFADLVERGPR